MNDKKNKIKILCCYHKKAKLLKNDIVVPIHVGRAVAKEQSKDGVISDKDYKWLLKNMIGDDTGDNISHLNRKFCELTAIYWAWKNYDKLGNPDYIGLMHYRRLFNFSDKFPFGNYFNLLKKLKINKNNISLSKDTIVMPNITYTDNKIRHTFLNYNKEYKLSNDYYPELFEQMKIFDQKRLIFWGNIFIMPKDVFFEYCNTIFNLCFNVLKQENIVNFKERYFGYSTEYLTSFYVLSLAYKNKCTIEEKPIFWFENFTFKSFLLNKFKQLRLLDNFLKHIQTTLKKLIARIKKLLIILDLFL